MLCFLSKHVYKMQLYLRPFYSILRRQKNIFEWTLEHQKCFDEIKISPHRTNIKHDPRSRSTILAM